jgi:Tfp pilus assembly protein FimT
VGYFVERAIRFFIDDERERNVKRLMKRREGITLIELTVVMCILAIMVMISIPNIGRWLPRYRLRSAVRDMASTMQLARLSAIKENKDWAIQFDADAQTYTLWNSGADGKWLTADDVTISTTDLDKNYPKVSFGDNGYGPWPGDNPIVNGETFKYNYVVFRPDGTAGPENDNGIVGSAYFQNNRGDAACARIRFTGSGVEVLHWNGNSWEPESHPF